MATPGDIGSVSIDVTADTPLLQAKLDTFFRQQFELKTVIELPRKAELQKRLDKATGTGLKLFIDELNMPGKREMQAQLDKKTGKGLTLKIFDLGLPTKKAMQEQLNRRVGVGLKLFIDELNMPGQKEMQAQLDQKSGKSGSRGLKLFIDELNMPGFQEIQAQVDIASKRHAANGLKLFIDELNLPGKKEMQAQLDSKVGTGLKLRVRLDLSATSLAGAGGALTLLDKVEEARLIAEARGNAQVKKSREILDAQLAKSKIVALQKELDAEADYGRRRVLREQITAEQKAVINERLRARLIAQDQAFAQRQVFAAERTRRKLEEIANKPVLQRILLNTDRVNQSLRDFDRTVSNVLRTSLTAFSVWSAGVAALTAAAAAAAIYNFAKIEEASLRAGAVFTSDAYSEALLQTGVAFEDFADRAVKSSEEVRAASNRIAVETIFNPAEVAAGAQAFAQAGLNQADTLDQLAGGMSNLAVATRFAQNEQIAISEAVELGVAGLNSAGLATDELAGLYDKFTIAANSTNASAKEIAQAFSNAGAASFRSYGQSVEEAITTISLFAKVNERGLAAGTQTDILIREVSRSAFVKAPEVWERYGIALEDANGKARPFADALVDLANLLRETQKEKGNAAYVRLRKDLDLTEKSARGLVRLAPQLNDIGLQGVNAIRQNLTNAAGATARQAEVLTQSITVQFGNFVESFGIQLQKIGEFAAPGFKDLLDRFNGPGGLFEQLAGSTQAFGEDLNDIFFRIAEFVDTQAFADGVKTLGDAIEVTLRGVADAFIAFSGAFNDLEPAQSTFEAIAESILGFSRVAATVLPIVARLLGQVFDFLIDNADAFETFAKMTVALYALRRAYALIISPIGRATASIIAGKIALEEMATVSTLGSTQAALVSVASKFGLISTSANAATASIEALTVAELVNAKASVRATGGAAAGAGALGLVAPTRPLGLFRRQRLETDLRATATGGAAALGGPAALAEFNAAQQAKAAAGFTKALNEANPAPLTKSEQSIQRIAELLGRVSPRLESLAPSIQRIGSAFSKIAAPIAVVVGLIQTGIGFVEGFRDGFRLSGEGSAELQRSLLELAPIFDFIKNALTETLAVLGTMLNTVERLGASIGRLVGATLTEALILVGDFVRALKALFSGDFTEFFRAIGDVLINALTLSFRTVLATLLDLVADAAAGLSRIPKVGDEFEQLEGQMRDAAVEARSWRVNMSAAEEQARRTGNAALLASSPINGLSAALGGGAASIARTVRTRTDQAATALERFTQRLIATNAQARAAFAEIVGIRAQQAALARVPGFLQELPIVQEQAAKIGANAEKKFLTDFTARQQRNRRLLRQQAQETAAAAVPELAGAGGAAAQPEQREFVDPNIAVQDAIDRLKPAARIAQVNALVTKATSDASKGYQLTRRETLLLADALPELDKAIEKQRTEVQALDTALSDLRNTQLAGSQAFSDAAFANEQAIKKLQLARLDALAVAGTTEESAPVVAIDEQIKALQAAAERAQLEESLKLDPLRRKLDQTFAPVREDTFGNIITQFRELSAQQETQQAALARREAQQARLNAVLQTSQERFQKIDEAAQRSIEAFNKAQTAAAGTSSAIGGVAASSKAAATAVDSYSTAVENVPTGKGVVDKSLRGIRAQVQTLAPQFQGSGTKVMQAFTLGITTTAQNLLYPALANIVTTTLTYMRSTIAPAKRIGERVMGSFLAGLKSGFGSPAQEGSVAWYLNVFIPQWIKDNKGPVAYDATILVPAGEAVMEGFGRGLRSGFSQIQSFVRDVGPSLKEFISADAFSGRTATVMADIALGKTPDIEGIFGDLRGAVLAGDGGFAGVTDPRLQFLHQTLSLADTQQMAASLVRTFGTTGGISTDRAAGTLTAAGNLSAHTLGTAADMGTGGSRPTAASLAMFNAIKPLLGSIFAEIIHNGVGLEAGGGSFPDSQHYDHVHAQWIAGKGFDKYSGKIGTPPVFNIPEASPAVDAAISEAGRRYDIEIPLLAAIAKQESSFRPSVVSFDGGYGLFQLTSAAAQSGVSNLFDPLQNALGGARFFRGLLDQFGGNIRLALAGYNAGPGAAYDPPASTRNTYIPNVLRYLEEYRRLFGGFRERGGEVRTGRSYIVGERGPELFTPGRSGGITRADQTARIMDGGGARPMTYNDNRQITVTTNASDADAVGAMVDAHTRTSLAGINFG